MTSLVGLVFLLRFGSIPPHEPVSFRVAAHQVALESLSRAPTISMRLDDGARTLDLPLLYGSGPVTGPLRPAYRPSDWISKVAHRLNVAEHPLAKAAIWIAETPLSIDARPGQRVCLKLTFRGF